MAVRVHTAHKQLEGGGFEVTRPFPGMSLQDMDPFLLLDQMGPTDVRPGEAKGAPDHPHRGFETVTYMLEGELEHRDSHGNYGVLGPGTVQWMTAGAGVVHSEMPSERFQSRGGRSHGVQLWVNLPAKDKMMAPRYQDIPAQRIPTAEVPGGWVKVISGRYGDVKAVIDTRIPIRYLHFHLDAGAAADVEAPEGHTAFVYVLLGSGQVSGEKVRAGQIALVDPGTVALAADAGGMDALFLSGRPIGEPVARYGPFVMNTRDEIVQAVRDFQEGRFGEIAATMEHGEGGRARKPYLPGRDEAPDPPSADSRSGL